MPMKNFPDWAADLSNNQGLQMNAFFVFRKNRFKMG